MVRFGAFTEPCGSDRTDKPARANADYKSARSFKPCQARKVIVNRTAQVDEASEKQLFVVGDGFDSGAKILVNDEQKASNDDQHPTSALIAKKSGKRIARGQTVTLQVRNSDGTLSNQFSFTR